MPALDGAFPLVEMHVMAMGITENLDFDMSWGVEKFFQVERRCAKGGFGAILRGGECLFDTVRSGDNLHANAAAQGFQEDGVTQRSGQVAGLAEIQGLRAAAGNDRNASGLSQLTRRGFIPHHLHGVW